MPVINTLVKGCAYNSQQPIAAFNLWNMAVVIEARRITVYKAANAAEGRAVMDWLKHLLKTPIESQ